VIGDLSYPSDIKLSFNIRRHLEVFSKKTIEAVTLMQSAFEDYEKEINSEKFQFYSKNIWQEMIRAYLCGPL